MEVIELVADNREILGKKVKQLRRKGITPVHLFGHQIPSMALQVPTNHLLNAMHMAGKTRLIDLKVKKERRTRKVLVREIQTSPYKGELLHVDFYQVRGEEKLTVEVPIILVGEAPALKHKENILVRELDNITVECLPTQIPTSIDLDLSILEEAEQAIRVGDITLSEGVRVLIDPELVVAKITAKRAERIVEEVVAEEVIEAPVEPSVSEEEPQEGETE
jgi:large subunit ribosomal protein L25